MAVEAVFCYVHCTRNYNKYTGKVILNSLVSCLPVLLRVYLKQILLPPGCFSNWCLVCLTTLLNFLYIYFPILKKMYLQVELISFFGLAQVQLSLLGQLYVPLLNIFWFSTKHREA